MGTRVPYGITQFYLPPGRGDIPAFTPAEAGTRLSDPGGMQGWVDLVIISNVIFARQAIFSTLHSDEHLLELIITCSFIDITNFTCILILYGLSHNNLLELFKNVLDILEIG